MSVIPADLPTFSFSSALELSDDSTTLWAANRSTNPDFYLDPSAPSSWNTHPSSTASSGRCLMANLGSRLSLASPTSGGCSQMPSSAPWIVVYHTLNHFWLTWCNPHTVKLRFQSLFFSASWQLGDHRSGIFYSLCHSWNHPQDPYSWALTSLFEDLKRTSFGFININDVLVATRVKAILPHSSKAAVGQVGVCTSGKPWFYLSLQEQTSVFLYSQITIPWSL